MSPVASQILVVEDDPVSRRILEMALGRQGYQVIAAENAAEAQAHLSPAKISAINCVVTDYLMPGINGLELLIWIRQQDASLATIMVTAQNEKDLIADSLRGGAVDFLEKPLDLKKLRAAVTRAVTQTCHQRHLAQSASAIRKLGLVQQRMLGAGNGPCQGIPRVYSHPVHDAGGDHFNHFRPTADRLFCLLTDVSGHDVQATYLSAFFQGFVRGALSRGASLEEIFRDFNHFLLNNTNDDGESLHTVEEVAASVAVCGLLVDFSAGTATVITQGAPPPIYLPPEGEVQVLGDNNGVPLGWFPELSLHATTHPFVQGGVFCLWTDGLGDLAAREGTSPLSLAYALQQSREPGTSLPCLTNATDDILLAVVDLAGEKVPEHDFWQVISERYHGGQAAEIDRLQSYWRRSLLLMAPELPASRLHDILLGSREALLNALNHGCRCDGRQSALFQLDCSRQRQLVRVTVSDPGPGHKFDIHRHEQRAGQDLPTEHRGLILMKYLANRLRLDQHGTRVIMEFEFQSSPPSPEFNL